MPELPDLTVYAHALRARVVDRVLTKVSIKSPFLLRTVDPSVDEAEGRRVLDVSLIGKRIVLSLEGDLHLAIHLMIAGRLLWKKPGTNPSGKIDLAAFTFDPPSDDGGVLVLTEASKQKRASLHVVRGAAGLDALRAGGLDPLSLTAEQCAIVLTRENRTLKRALTDPRNFSGIGNAYSDEILFAARLSPVSLTQSMKPEQIAALAEHTRSTLLIAIEQQRRQFGQLVGDSNVLQPGRFPGPGQITAFRPEFNVHGKYLQPCRVCQTPIQRIVRAENEINYCPRCQTGGKLLADRSLSRLLKADWPATIEEWEAEHRA